MTGTFASDRNPRDSARVEGNPERERAEFVTEGAVGLGVGIDEAGVWRFSVAGD